MNPTSHILGICLTIAIAASMVPRAADADDRPGPEARGSVLDHRYSHNRYYPPRGHVVHELPRDARVSHWHGSTYYLHSGIWYRPARSNWIVVAPPIGLTAAALPPFYTTIWVGGVMTRFGSVTWYATR